MELTPREKDKLLIFTAGLLAERRRARGLKLNYPEAIGADLRRHHGGRARWPQRRRADAPRRARSSGAQEVMDGVAEMIPDIQIEATFPDSTKLVTIHDPIV